MIPLIHTFDADGYLMGSSEMPPGAAGVNPAVATQDDLPAFNPDTHRARRVSGAWVVEVIPVPEPGPEPELPTIEQVKADLQVRVNSQYAQRMNEVALPYPQYERESWPIQLQEAQALAVDPTASTPWIDACAAQRGLECSELAQRILTKDSAYRFISGQLTGARQAHEDAIEALLDIEELRRYDVTTLWPQ
ncbi:hypothetical protein N5D77_22585 [Comamonas thiooxydans]|uniref:DUF4376 domain-containing protein n=1 Tax=Comamonas thiooxydans TaxID=363952 RepID=A0AA42Q403_9BURK|nr:hypothetical protein [Comamonas thiooxydans]MDH1336853.1 hypothetical protein [Comamonas thiooxydans]MDH1743782.1 hypothetical protein [Comamonas thiooxydans]MDH1789368.1 hypothetical protein [Comamonas thiooxydans]